MARVGWLLPEKDRNQLLALFPPVYADIFAHHVSLNQTKNPILPTETEAKIVGYATDDIGLEALVVEINATTERQDGGTFHITWSLDRAQGYKPVMSNDVIDTFGWKPTTPVSIRLEPSVL